MNRQFLVTMVAASLLAACGMPEAGDWPELSAEEQALYQQALEERALDDELVVESAAATPVDRVSAGAEGSVAVPDGKGGVFFVSVSSASSGGGDEASSTQDPIPTKNRRDAVLLDHR